MLLPAPLSVFYALLLERGALFIYTIYILINLVVVVEIVEKWRNVAAASS